MIFIAVILLILCSVNPEPHRKMRGSNLCLSLNTNFTTLYITRSLPLMAAPTATPLSSYTLLLRTQTSITQSLGPRPRKTSHCSRIPVRAVQDSGGGKRAPPGVDTRIHWDSEEEGWIGASTSGSTKEQKKEEDDLLGKKFSDLLNSSSDSYYQFLGVPANADLEEIKAAYRRLSKEYHPDTTVLPLRAASEKFMKLREVYNVLSDDEKRNFYDWTLAQEAAGREAETMRMKLKDPYIQDVENWESIPDMVDRLGGRNMELNDQAKQALTFDILVIIFAICCIIYVAFFKEPY